VFRSVVHKSVKLAEAPSHGKTIFEYAAGSRGAADFARLAREILRAPPPASAAGAEAGLRVAAASPAPQPEAVEEVQ
jgi:chromosome partitioning protein